ncbi:MAG: hypothetical protein ABI419_06805, partial [Ginsengibacter sp.]
MKNINIISLIAIFSIGLFNSAGAQRRAAPGGERNNSRATISQPQVERAPQRTFNNPARTERVNNSSPRVESRNNSAPRIESRNNS